MNAPLIGVVGANGAVGSTVVRQLLVSGHWRLRLGSRKPLPSLITRLQSKQSLEVLPLEVTNAQQLQDFCRGCSVIVNCTAPSFRLLDIVARSAFAVNADYVDPGGDEPLHEQLRSLPLARLGRTSMLTAGMMPGLSALMVRRIAHGAGFHPHHLVVYVGGRGRISTASALDYILSMGHDPQASLAAWSDGQRVPRALRPVANVALPYFPAGATAYPYIGSETVRVARALGISDVSWYNVFEGTHMTAALARLQGAMGGVGDADAAAQQLSRSADLDLFGLTPYQLIYVQVDGTNLGLAVRRTVLLRGASAQELSGCVAAITAESLLRGELPPGLHYAGEVLPTRLIESLRSMPTVSIFAERERLLADADPVEEGAL